MEAREALNEGDRVRHLLLGKEGVVIALWSQNPVERASAQVLFDGDALSVFAYIEDLEVVRHSNRTDT